MSLLRQNNRKKILLGQDGNSLVLLIIVNVIIFLFLSFIKIVYVVNNSTESVFDAQVFNLFSMPAQPQTFATRPWGLLSYMFIHNGLWQLVTNMLWLWGFGYILQDFTGNRKLIPVYLYGGLAGSVFFILTVNLIPGLRQNVNSVFPLAGAAPALTAVAIATTTLAPRYRIFPMINIPLWVLTAVFIVLIVGTTGPENIGHLASLVAGGLMGYVFVWQLEKGNDLGQWMTDLVNWTDDLFNPKKKHVHNAPSKQLFYKSTQKPFRKTPHVTQQRIDDLLDKINHKGYHSLSEEEKDFLKKASQEEL